MNMGYKRPRGQRNSDMFTPDSSPIASPPVKRCQHNHLTRPIEPPRKSGEFVLSSTSFSHLAHDIDSFTSYIPFRSFIETTTGTKAILGLGSIEYPIFISGSLVGSLTLHDVLHVPTAGANVLSAYQLTREGYQITMSPFQGGSELRHVRNDIPPVKLVCVDQMFILPGHTSYTASVPPSIHLHFQWPIGERRRWLEYQASLVRPVQEVDGMDFIRTDLPYVST